MLTLLLLFAQAATLPPSISMWRADISRDLGVRVPIVWVGDELRGDSEGFDLVTSQLQMAGFRNQFSLMHAAAISSRTSDGDQFAVLVNMRYQDAWRGFEAALLGHELGHVWLRALKLPAPAFSGRALGCLSIHTGDAVQHVLIRAEMDRRGIDHRAFLKKGLDDAVLGLEQSTGAADPCAWVRQAAIWVDARLALSGKEWAGRARYEAAAEKRYPEASVAVRRIESHLAGKDLSQPQAHQQALVDVFDILQELAAKQQTRAGQ